MKDLQNPRIMNGEQRERSKIYRHIVFGKNIYKFTLIQKRSLFFSDFSAASRSFQFSALIFSQDFAYLIAHYITILYVPVIIFFLKCTLSKNIPSFSSKLSMCYFTFSPFRNILLLLIRKSYITLMKYKLSKQ